MSGVRLAIRYDRWCGWMLGVLGLGRRFSGVVVSDDELSVRMGWSFDADIPRSSIVSIEHDEGRVWGWGVHGWRRRWLVNGSSSGLVRIELDPPAPSHVCFVPVKLETLRISLEDPEFLLAAVDAAP